MHCAIPTRAPRSRFAPLLGLWVVALTWGGCACETPPRACRSAEECPFAQACVMGECRGERDAALATDAPRTDCEPACASGALCFDGACVLDRGPCVDSSACADDTRCESTLGRCIPWGVPPTLTFDRECTHAGAVGAFAPTLQCAFSDAPPLDPFPEHLHVLSTPMVVDFAFARGPDDPARPSIVAVFDDGVDGGSEEPSGVIRVLDGATCVQQAELGSLALVSHSSPVALGDLDGDGRAEIVAYGATGGLIAFTYEESSAAWRILWRSTRSDGSAYSPTGQAWAGPTLTDLDDDGRPEVLRGALVFDADGVLIDESMSSLLDLATLGAFAVVADVDEDGDAELVAGQGVWEWDRAARAWMPEAYSMGGTAAGHVAVADFGAFPGAVGWDDDAPEVVVISGGTARIQTLDGSIVFGPVALPGGGQGGPPTIADFDGDARPEFASAGANAYTVFDPDCGPVRDLACASGTLDGVLWSQRSQDASSNVTGSSVFDFEGDGRAEAVYGDECFLRVYDGETGTVVFSQSRSSCTWYENPVVADVDGDFNAEIVIGDNWNCPSPGFTTGRDCSGFGLDARQTDPLFAGLRCEVGAECVSGVCDAGLCRCTSDASCCMGEGCAASGIVCTAPPTGTLGSGDTCRASRPEGTRGIRVYRDGDDRWVRSRMVWNQHAYFVTQVDEAGRIPRTSETRMNWLSVGLNNFRQNVQGDAVPGAAPDLTVRALPVACDEGGARVRAAVCNRGSEPVGSGVGVSFFAGDPALGMRICDASTVGDLREGACEEVECPWPDAPGMIPGVDLWIVVDGSDVTTECLEANNVAVLLGAYCGAPL